MTFVKKHPLFILLGILALGFAVSFKARFEADPQRSVPLTTEKAIESEKRFTIGLSPSTMETRTQEFTPSKQPVSFDDLNKNELLLLSENLKRFKFLTDKALLSKRENEELAALVNTEAFLDQVAERISSYVQQDQQALARRSRIVAISALAYAAERGSQSTRERAMDMAEDLVRKDSIRAEWPKDIKKGFVGDKLELLMLIHRYDPERIERMKQDIEGEQNKKILNYASQQIEIAKATQKT